MVGIKNFEKSDKWLVGRSFTPWEKFLDHLTINAYFLETSSLFTSSLFTRQLILLLYNLYVKFEMQCNVRK